jgi:D-erythronate 2-dehydrogenase
MTMHILITGAAGMIGRKLTARLVAARALNGQPIARLSLLDVGASPHPEGFAGRVDILAADIADLATARTAISGRPQAIFHLAAVVSGEAELDFDKGMHVNFDGARALFEAIRTTGDGYRPRLVFSSSIAVFGAPFPETIPDDFALTPLTSYGAQKAAIELLLADYTRRGFIDGVGIRLPNIVVRPGKPNKAASGFFSSIIREPLNGEDAVLPVAETVRNWHASPRAAVGFLIHAAGIASEAIAPRINLTMPGICCTVAEQIAALKRIAGDKVAARIRHVPDPLVARIVAGWPARFAATRALALGFRAEASFDDIIRAHIEDELGGRIAA